MINHNLFCVLARIKFSNSKIARVIGFQKSKNAKSKLGNEQNTIEYTKFMFLANQVLKFYIDGEKLDTKLQVLRLPKTFQAAVYNRE